MSRPNFWFDATIQVRVYLDGMPPEDTEDLELALTRLIDGRDNRHPELPGVMLSCQDVDLGDPAGFRS